MCGETLKLFHLTRARWRNVQGVGLSEQYARDVYKRQGTHIHVKHVSIKSELKRKEIHNFNFLKLKTRNSFELV